MPIETAAERYGINRDTLYTWMKSETIGRYRLPWRPPYLRQRARGRAGGALEPPRSQAPLAVKLRLARLVRSGYFPSTARTAVAASPISFVSTWL